MKIIHITQCYNDGFGYHENILPKYQLKLGHDVIVVTSERESYFKELSDKNRRKEPREYMEGPVRIVRIPIKGEFRGRFVIFANLKDVLEIERPDYIFHHGLIQPSLFTISGYKKKHPSVFVVADEHADLTNSARNVFWKIGYYNFAWKNALKRSLKYIDIVFGVTPARCYFLNEELGVPWSLIRLLPQGADEDLAQSINSDTLKENDSKERLLVITGGKINKNKNVLSLFDAITGLDLELRVFGALSAEMKAEIADNPPYNVIFHGWQNRVQTFKLLAQADIAIWNKLHTNLIEDAIATLTPLILRYHGSTCYQIRNNGFYLYSDNPNEIRQHLEFIIRHKEILFEMRQEARKIRDFLSYNRIAQESIDYYYDKAPKITHEIIMNDPMCLPKNKEFRKLK